MPQLSVQRKPAMDIIRCFALFFVVSVHFFLNNGFYDEIVKGPNMLIMTFMRSFFMICVPLFLLLSGYLMCNKTINKGYYKKIIYIISIYILASACCFFYNVVFKNAPLSVTGFVKGVFNYSTAPYSWYVEMYIGLFLLCPFLNLIYNNLKSKKDKLILLATMLFLTSLPNITNIFVPDLNWFLNPNSSYDYFKLLPSYWIAIYPITYYFLGCYLKEYKLNISCTKIALLSVLVFLINGAFNYYRSYNFTFAKGAWQHYASLLIIAQAVLFFAFFDNLDYSKFPNFASKILKKISGLCFGGYLVSWIFDDMLYKRLNSAVPNMHSRLYYYIIIVPCIFVCSILLSFLINSIYNAVAACFNNTKKPKKADDTKTESSTKSLVHS